MSLSSLRFVAASASVAVLFMGLQSCTSKMETALPEGVQTMTGVLVPVPLSMSRDGTHILTMDGEKVYMVESAKADLRDFEGVDVVITGSLERNSDPKSLPVLVASGVTLVTMPVRHWATDALSLSLDTPENWSMKQFEDGIQFTQTGTTTVLLKIYTSSLTSLPAGSILQVAGHKAARVSGSGAQTVYVQNGRTILAFTYQAHANDSLTNAERDFNRVLRSVTFTGSATSSAKTGTGSASVPSTTSEATGNPCGGPAGVLCPAGQYCEVTDTTDGVGRCRALKR